MTLSAMLPIPLFMFIFFHYCLYVIDEFYVFGRMHEATLSLELEDGSHRGLPG
jgi:hypothetical protein